MVAESFAILVVCFLLVVAFMRSRFRKGVFSVMPITIIPLLHLLAKAVVYVAKGQILGIRGLVVIAFIDVVALGITCALIAALGHKINTKINRRVYYAVMVGYSLLIGWAYIFNTLEPLLVGK